MEQIADDERYAVWFCSGKHSLTMPRLLKEAAEIAHRWDSAHKGHVPHHIVVLERVTIEGDEPGQYIIGRAEGSLTRSDVADPMRLLSSQVALLRLMEFDRHVRHHYCAIKVTTLSQPLHDLLYLKWESDFDHD